jgi:hypothetical protein
MDRTAAERQTAFRRKMRARGYRQKQIWVDAEGFPGRGGGALGFFRPSMTLEQLTAELVRLTGGMDEEFARRLYAELAAHARGIKAMREETRLQKELPELYGGKKEEPEPEAALF